MFLIKKFIASFFMPFPIFMITLGIGLYSLYRKNYVRAVKLIIFAFLWLSFLSYAPFSALLISPLENTYSKLQLNGKKASYIHVLGTSHTANDDIPLSSQLNSSGLVRVNEGVAIYKQYKNMKIVFSGYGNDETISNAKKNSIMAILLGVNKDDIILLEQPKDTYEEALAVKNIIGNQTLVLVTSASHMVRAIALFKKAGINVIAAPTDFIVKKKDDLLRMPGSEGLRRSEIAFHEYLGLVWSKLRGYI